MKLFITDMDGCLLDESSQLPHNFDACMKEIQETGNYFGVASGRSYPGLNRMFHSYVDSMCFIADNGGYVNLEGNDIYIAKMDNTVVKEVVLEARKYKDLVPVLCGKNTAYIENYSSLDKKTKDELTKYYIEDAITDVSDLSKVDAPIVKIALLYFDDIEKNISSHFKHFDTDVEVCVTAYVWMDLFNKDNNKGTGVHYIQEALGVSKEDTIVFGDYLNDISMKDYAHRSCAPSNAHTIVKETFTDIIGSNKDNAVLNEILKEIRKKS